MLVGRDQEQRAVARVLADARSSRSAVLALIGEPGIGKTALLDAAEATATGLRVLRARGIESETQLPFAALFDLLRPALHLVPRLPRPQAAALEAALALGPGTSAERFAAGAATLSLLAAFADESPLLLLVDDAHLIDAASGEALRFVLRRLLAEPVGAILAVRDGERSFVDGTDLPRLHLQGLDREATVRLLGPAVPPEAADRLYHATAGNPLALRELAAAGAGVSSAPPVGPLPVSDTISEAFAKRARMLPSAAQHLLFLVAADDTGDMAVIARAAVHLGLNLAPLTEAEDDGLLEVRDGRVEFRHPLLRAAIYAMAPQSERRRIHRALARSFPDRDADRRAWHLAAAALGVDDDASHALEEAGERAERRSAYAVASMAFERAARLSTQDERRTRLHVRAAEQSWLAGDSSRALELLPASDPATHAETLIRSDSLRGRIAARRGPVLAGYRILVDAAQRAGDLQPDVAIGLLADGIDAGLHAAAVREMVHAARRIDELLPAANTPRARFLGNMATGVAFVFTAESRNGIARIRDGISVLHEHPAVGEETALLPWLLVAPLFLREAGTKRSRAERAIATARERGALSVLPGLLIRVARDHAASAQWDDAMIEYDEAARLAREAALQTDLAAALAGLAWLDARCGREMECRQHAEEALLLSSALGAHLFEIWSIRAVGELELAHGRAALAVPHLQRCGSRMAELGIEDVDISPAAELCDAYLRTGDVDGARLVSERLTAAAGVKAQPWALARAARCRGLVADGGDWTSCFAEAIALHERTPDIFELGVTQLAFGSRLRRSRRRTDSRAALRAAFEIFERLGASPWAEMARVELLATGENPRPRSEPASDRLTKQELHIARLLAGGATTREVAAALFLSPKTIEYHLHSIYAKLGVNTRAELARWC